MDLGKSLVIVLIWISVDDPIFCPPEIYLVGQSFNWLEYRPQKNMLTFSDKLAKVALIERKFPELVPVSDCVKPISQCHRRRVCI